MKRVILAALIALTIPALIAAAPDVDFSWDEQGDPDDLTVSAGDTPAYSVFATTAVDLGNTDVEDKRITITLLNTTDSPETITTLLNESIPDDQLCYPEGCQDEYVADLTPSEYGGIGDYQVITKVTQDVNGITEATTQTIQLTAQPQGTLNIDYISCNDVVVQGAQQYCTTKITDINGDAVSNAQFTLQYQDTNDVLGTCTTNQDGFCAVEPTITRDAGDYTVDGTATKQYWLPDNDGQPTDTFTVLTKKYTIENLETWADDFQTPTDEYFRGDTPRASFDVRNDVTGELLSPEDDIVTDVTLRVYDNNKKGGDPIKKEDLTPNDDPIREPGAFQFTLDQIPLTDDYLGQGKIFAFAINYTDNTGGQASKVVTIKNNPLEFNQIDDQTIPAGETQTLDLTSNIDDLETPDENIEVDITNTGPYTVEQTGTLTYDVTAPSQEAQQTINVEADDTDGSTRTQSFTATTNALLPPEADFTHEPDTPVVGQTVTLTSNSSDEDGTIESYEWTFDGPKNKQTGEQIQTTFNQPGDYDVTLKVTDNDGLTDTKTRTVTVADDNQAPTADFQYDPQNPVTGEYVTFTSTSTDPDGFITQTNWTVTGPNTDLTINGQDQFATQFNQPGDYDVTITVTDDDGATDTTTKTITVTQANRAPQLETIPDQTTPEAQLYTYQAEATDPDGDELSWSISGADFITVDDNGQITGTPDYDDAGTYNVDITVSDGSLTNTTTYTLTVTDVNRAPDASFQFQPATPTVGEQVTFTATSTDPDGDQLTHEWDFDGDGQTDATGEQVTYTFTEAGNYQVTLTSSDGSLSDTATQTIPVSEEPNQAPTADFTFNPDNPETSETVTFDASQSFDPDGTIEDYTWEQGSTVVGNGQTTTITFNQPGDYPVTLTVTDDDGAQNTTTKTVPVEQSNRDPTIKPIDDQSTPENQTYTYQAQATDPDGDELSWSISGADFLTIDDNGQITGTPGFDDAGDYHITVSVNDGRGGSDTETYTLTVTDANRDPVLEPVADKQVTKGTTVSIDADATDLDGDTVTYSISPDRGSFNTQTGEWTWTPSQTGTYTYTVTATDGRSGTDTESFTVTVIEEPNTPPFAFFTANPSNPVTGETVTLDAAQSFDSDGTIESYEWTIDGQQRTGEQIQTSFDEPGDYPVTLTVTDDDGAQNTTTKTVHVDQANRAPDADFTFNPANPTVGEQVTFTATSTDPDGDQLTHEWDFDNDGTVDATGEQVTYTFNEAGSQTVTLTSSDGSLSDTETETVPVSEEPNKAPFAEFDFTPDNPETGETVTFDASQSFDEDGTIESYEWTFSSAKNTRTGEKIQTSFDEPGSYDVTLTVTDDDGAQNTTTKTVHVDQANRAPSLDLIPDQATPEGDQYTYQAEATDPDGDELSWSVSGADFLTINSDGQITGTPGFDDAGDYHITVTVSDGSLTNTTTYTLTVTDVNRAPDASFQYQPTTPTVGEQVTFTATTTDPDGDQLTHEWDFDNDGSIDATGEQVTYTFDEPGNYPVTLTSSDGSLSDTATQTIPVDEANNPPQVGIFVNTVNPEAGDNITASSTASDTDGSITQYNWTVQLNNNVISSGNGQSFTFKASEKGTYTITHSVKDDDGATNTTNTTVSVSEANTAPIASFNYTPQTPTTDETVTFTSTSFDPDGDTITQGWDVDGDGDLDVTGNTATFQYEEPGTYDVTLRVSDGDLENTTTQTITVVEANKAPTADFNVTPPNPTTDTTTTLTSNGSDPDGQIVAYSWDITGPDGYESTINDSEFPEHVIVDGFPTAGTYTVTHTVEDNDGATDSITKDIDVAEANNAPQASFTIRPENPLTDRFINFNDTSIDDDGEIVYNEWRLTGPNTDRFITNISAFATKLQDPGDYEMTLTVRDNDGANDSETETFTVDKAIPPVADFTYKPDQPVVNDTVTLNASESFDPDGTIESYQWFVNGIGAGTTETTTYTALDIQDDNVTLDVTDDDGLTTTTSKTIPVDKANEQPQATFNVTPKDPAAGQTVVFNASESFDPDGTITNYDWRINNTSVDEDGPIFDQGFNLGTYEVSLTVTDNEGATATTTKQLTVDETNEDPVADFTITPASPEVNTSVTLDASESFDPDGTITNYEWIIMRPDGMIQREGQSLQTITLNTTITGTYNVTLNVDDDRGGRGSTTKTFTVLPGKPPVARLNAANTASKGETVGLDASESTDADGTIESYEWTVTVRDTTVAETTTTTPTLTYIPRSTGTYEATVTVTDNDNLADTAQASTTVSKEDITVEPDTEVTLGQYGVYSDGGLGVIRKGEPFTVRAGVSNDGSEQAEDLRLTFTLPEYGYERNGKLFNSGDENGETRQINAYLPSYIPAGEYTGYVRVRGDDVHRQKTVPVTVTR